MTYHNQKKGLSITAAVVFLAALFSFYAFTVTPLASELSDAQVKEDSRNEKELPPQAYFSSCSVPALSEAQIQAEEARIMTTMMNYAKGQVDIPDRRVFPLFEIPRNGGAHAAVSLSTPALQPFSFLATEPLPGFLPFGTVPPVTEQEEEELPESSGEDTASPSAAPQPESAETTETSSAAEPSEISETSSDESSNQTDAQTSTDFESAAPSSGAEGSGSGEEAAEPAPDSSYYNETTLEYNPGISYRDPIDGSREVGGHTEIEYLAAICRVEAGFHYENCLAVANVIINRLQHGGYGSTIYDVIYAPYQFATGWRMDEYLAEGPSEVPLQAVYDALSGINNIGEYRYFNGTYWLDPATLSKRWVVIGDNCFYER